MELVLLSLLSLGLCKYDTHKGHVEVWTCSGLTNEANERMHLTVMKKLKEILDDDFDSSVILLDGWPEVKLRLILSHDGACEPKSDCLKLKRDFFHRDGNLFSENAQKKFQKEERTS
jgi:hypothetical protein